MTHGLITLLTDFGLHDPFVGVMKGVILSILPDARLVDLTHDVTPQDVAEANFQLRGAYRYFPAGTVHLVVVDPGVGSARRALCARAAGMTFVAPDNGVLSGIIGPGDPVHELRNPGWLRDGTPSNTFHGRDVFAPAAARLAAGAALEDAGPAAGDPVTLSRAEPVVDAGGRVLGAVLHVDRFGNLITNLRQEHLARFAPRPCVVAVGGTRVGVPVTSYAAAEAGRPLAIVDSYGFLEIAVNRGDARAHFAAGPGTPVTLEPGA